MGGGSRELDHPPTGPLKGYYEWLPALVFQVVLALWLLIKGVATPARLSAPSQDV